MLLKKGENNSSLTYNFKDFSYFRTKDAYSNLRLKIC